MFIKVLFLKLPKPKRTSIFQSTRLVLACGVLGVGLTFLVQHLLSIRSSRAYINGDIVYIRAPIAGNLQLNNQYVPGEWIESNTVLGQVSNPRANTLILRREELKTQLSVAQKSLLSLNNQASTYEKILNKLDGKIHRYDQQLTQQKLLQNQQQKLELAQTQRDINQSYAELSQQKEAAAIAEKEAQRYQKLAQEQVVSASQAEKLKSVAKQLQENVNKATESYQQSVQQLQINEANLSSVQINFMLRVGDTENRQQQLLIHQQDLAKELIGIQQKKISTDGEIQAIKTELNKIEKQLKIDSLAAIKPAFPGPIWSIKSRSHEYLEANEVILAMVNCRNRWVEALVSEQSAAQLSPGMAVQIKLLGETQQRWRGEILAIRAGVGRMSAGEDVVGLLKDLPQRQVALRIGVEWTEPTNSQEFCFVGRSAEVVIPRFGKKN
ncbi:HlyD family efflux transporter periplasmic adaptor subunit [Nostoc sp. TCL26-01]|uniref:HlyD family efflux transporter periplasmic adaptor subunit n=1 Tax=Nostoc sp. TCL26-01 TaxID=2576904 RepID=UPI0015BABF13|nr:HlyD family secretion protein [Nostoc sp. TCL26-01]QLE54408.1 HlyD family efflux transporter periplasmic adaptor subunit [Nostoc sp. TCL26-01]